MNNYNIRWSNQFKNEPIRMFNYCRAWSSILVIAHEELGMDGWTSLDQIFIRFTVVPYYWKKTMDYNKLCKDILGLDTKVRFAGICDESGEIKFGGQREGIKNLLTPEETKKSNLQAMARWGLRNSLSPKVGRGKYAMAEYEKIKRVTFPLDTDHLLLVTTEVDADHMNIINRILKQLSE